MCAWTSSVRNSVDKNWANKCESHNLGSFCPYEDASNIGYWDSYQVSATEWELLSDDYQATSGKSVWSTVATSAALLLVKGFKVILRAADLKWSAGAFLAKIERMQEANLKRSCPWLCCCKWHWSGASPSPIDRDPSAELLLVWARCLGILPSWPF